MEPLKQGPVYAQLGGGGAGPVNFLAVPSAFAVCRRCSSALDLRVLQEGEIVQLTLDRQVAGVAIV